MHVRHGSHSKSGVQKTIDATKEVRELEVLTIIIAENRELQKSSMIIADGVPLSALYPE